MTRTNRSITIPESVSIGNNTYNRAVKYHDTGQRIPLDGYAWKVVVEDTMGIEVDYYFQDASAAINFYHENCGV